MAYNFDLKKYLTENKLTSNSKLNESNDVMDTLGEGKKEVKEELQNDDMIYDRMMDMDQEQLISSMLSYAEQNPSVTLTDYLNDKFGYV
jgi:hypothetical protein